MELNDPTHHSFNLGGMELIDPTHCAKKHDLSTDLETTVKHKISGRRHDAMIPKLVCDVRRVMKW
jgi:hypothetical protein